MKFLNEKAKRKIAGFVPVDLIKEAPEEEVPIKDKTEDTLETDLFKLIDSMYDEKEEEE